jgi:hypothetical protein
MPVQSRRVQLFLLLFQMSLKSLVRTQRLAIVSIFFGGRGVTSEFFGWASELNQNGTFPLWLAESISSTASIVSVGIYSRTIEKNVFKSSWSFLIEIFFGDFRRFSAIFGDFRRFSAIFGDFRRFSDILGDFRTFSDIFRRIFGHFKKKS